MVSLLIWVVCIHVCLGQGVLDDDSVEVPLWMDKLGSEWTDEHQQAQPLVIKQTTSKPVDEVRFTQVGVEHKSKGPVVNAIKQVSTNTDKGIEAAWKILKGDYKGPANKLKTSLQKFSDAVETSKEEAKKQNKPPAITKKKKRRVTRTEKYITRPVANVGASMRDITGSTVAAQLNANRATPQPSPEQFKVKPVDIEDCTACKFVWNQVEMDVGNTPLEEEIFKSFQSNCAEASLSRIFYPTCSMMANRIQDFIIDYNKGFNPNQLCEHNGMCRTSLLFSKQPVAKKPK